MKRFCPNCGHPIKADAIFCPNCGYKLTKASPNTDSKFKDSIRPKDKPVASESQTKSQSKLRQSRRRAKPVSRKKKITITLVSILVVLLIALFAYGKHYYNKSQQVDRIVSVIRENKNSKLASLVTTNKAKVKIDSNSVKSITDYYQSHPSSLNMIENTLSNQGSIKGISLVQDGRYFLIFPKYKLQVNSYRPIIETNHPHSRIYIDGKYIATAQANDEDDDYTAELAPILGGYHTVRIKATASGHNLSSIANINLWSDSNYNCNIKTANLAVFGPTGSQIYVGRKVCGVIGNGQVKELKDFQYNNETSIHLAYKSHHHKFVSNEMNISDAIEADNNGSDTDDNDEDIQKAIETINKHYSKMVHVVPTFSGAPSLDTVHNLIKECVYEPTTSIFVNGKNNQNYGDFHRNADNFNDDHKLEDWDVGPDITNIYPVSKNIYSCAAKVIYELDHDTYTHIQVLNYPRVTFEKESGEFKILSMGKGVLIKPNKFYK